MNLLQNLPPSIFASVIIVTLSACGGSDKKKGPPEPPLVEAVDYQAILNNSITNELPGVILAIDGPATNFSGSAGLADIESNQSMETNHLMPNGSAGKKATALLAVLLAEQGMLNIDNTIDTWLEPELLDQIENSRDMTLRHLLTHTAGVHDYLDDETSELFFDAVVADPESIKTDEFALKFALNQPAYFLPGEGFEYSNTGYLLAGLILDKILGEHHYRTMRSQIFEPFGLTDTHYGALEKDRGDIISGYFFDEDDGQVNTKPFYINIGVADAPLVSSVSDLNHLIRSIVTDTLLISDDVRQLLIGENNLSFVQEDLYYGMGMFKEAINGVTVYHHGGDEVGYNTDNLYIEATDTAITLFINCNINEACVAQSDALWKEILNTLL
ncbi:MAG: beta-lactamase family protein [Kangiellaceae bacterium]|nr:beta-lactamase family protein [Kangiellaceae bacterium]